MSKKISLFTIPFAGGNKFSFNKFDKYLENDFDIYHLELPGRGERITEGLVQDIYAARDDLFAQIEDKIDKEYMIFGHSLGGILGYLLILLIEEKRLVKPVKFIISGIENPSVKSSNLKSKLPRDGFIEHIKKLGGAPKEFFDYPELFDFFEPILRSDFKISEEFKYDVKKKIDTKFVVLHGSKDDYSTDEALKWREFTLQDTDFYQFDGGHFFIFDYIEEICDIIKQR